jgi:hypothetical protein
MTITPDTKDWTWVLSRRCPECGFDAASFAREELPELTRANAAAWTRVLAAPGVRQRPAPEVWSPLEYACHVRDVLLRFTERVELMLSHDGPQFPNWDQDATAVQDRYAEQEPGLVTVDLGIAAVTLAAVFEAVSEDGWERTGSRSDGAVFTVESLGRYFLHDVVHHVHDVTGAGWAERG